jgi:hypothetical protein
MARQVVLGGEPEVDPSFYYQGVGSHSPPSEAVHECHHEMLTVSSTASANPFKVGSVHLPEVAISLPFDWRARQVCPVSEGERTCSEADRYCWFLGKSGYIKRSKAEVY